MVYDRFVESESERTGATKNGTKAHIEQFVRRDHLRRLSMAVAKKAAKKAAKPAAKKAAPKAKPAAKKPAAKKK